MLSQRRYFLIPVVVFLSTNLISASFLGIADEYSAFAFGPVTMENSDAGGRIAGMGNVTLNSYGMGKYATPSQYSLVSYGSVKCTNGSVSNGGIYSGNNTELYSAVVHGDIATKNNLLQQTGGTYDGSFITGGTATVEAYLNTKVINRDPGTCPVNFPAEEQRLVSQSRTLAASHINGTIQKDGYGSIIFNGSADVNFFSINSNDLLSAHTLDFRLPLNAIAIVNIAGVTVTFASKSIYCNAPEDILFNFSECLTLDVNSIGIRGSILAPGANVSFNYGYIDGNLIAKTITGNGEFHHSFFTHNIEMPPSITPVLERVIDNKDGTYSASFGYDNHGGAYSITPGTVDNCFYYQGAGGQSLGQPERFESGRVTGAFTVNFDGSDLEWNLMGETGSKSGRCRC